MNRRFQFLVVTSSTCLLVLLLAGSFLSPSRAADDAYRQFAVYSEVLQKIKSEYVEEPDMKNVTLGALMGMLEAIDPYASYLSADQYKQYVKSNENRKGEVGLVLARRFGYLAIVDAIPGSAAAKAGLGTGDLLESVAGVATRDMPLAFAGVLLHGDPGTKVDISVLRVRRGAEPQKMTLTREALPVPAVASQVLSGDIGYVAAPGLNPARIEDVARHARDLQGKGARRLVLDLRHNSIGKPEDGVALANLFLDRGLITYIEGQRVPRQNFEADPSKVSIRLPMVVITNRGTAGGAEVAAAALLDNKRAEVVGERTYGDAAVRRALTLEDGSAVILSVAKYYSPGGKSIQDNAVMPSVPMIESESVDLDEESPEPAAPKPEEDPLVKKAIEVLSRGVSVAGSQRQPAGTPLDTPKN
ncbi:MAG: S41 family peptidase [Bryobacteraceae bacterium]